MCCKNKLCVTDLNNYSTKPNGSINHNLHISTLFYMETKNLFQNIRLNITRFVSKDFSLQKF